VIFDRDGNEPAFKEQFHKVMARSQNALRDRWEKQIQTTNRETNPAGGC
jgi:hypothetical protein